MTTTEISYETPPQLIATLKKYQNIAAFIGLVFLVLLVAGYFMAGAEQFLRSYLLGMWFWFGMSMGCLVVLMIHYVAGGAWGVMIRRIAESASQTIPVWLVLFVPLIFGISSLYGNSWANPNVVAHDKVLQHKAAYLNATFWIIRGFVYLGGWTLLSFLLNKWSNIEDREGGVRPRERMAFISAPGLIFWVFSVTFMSTDWVMSVNPHWYSTMFGLIFVAGEALAAMSFMIFVTVALSRYAPMQAWINKRHMRDLGTLALANVMFFAYLSFSQFLITWAGNLPEEIDWYKHRLEGPWWALGLILVFAHFALPFCLLLSQDLKRDFNKIRWIAVLVFVARMVGVYWETVPEFFPGSQFRISWLDFTAPLGLGGLFVALFLTNLMKRPLIAPNNPNLEEALTHGRR
jgi:hypothetical protein